MGSLYRVPFYITDDLPETIEYAKSKGVSLYAAHLRVSALMTDRTTPEPVAL